MLEILKRHKRKLLGMALTLVTLGVAARLANSFMEPSHQLGVTEGKLAACPESPNCVSTQSSSPEHQIDPIPLATSAKVAIDRLESIINAMPRTAIVTRNDNYLHAEFRSFWMGYVDDVEFYIDESAGLIHFRSASRAGYSDLGVNRKRMERILNSFGKP